MPSNSFDFYARYGLFTYSQCNDLDGWEIVTTFTGLAAECIVAEELHANGGRHLHCFADFGKRRRFRRATFADVQGFHPNISSSYGTPWNGYDYCVKEGNVVAGGLERPTETSGGALSGKNDTWHQILEATSRDEFFELLRALAPQDLARCFPALSKYADFAYAEAEPVYGGPSYTDDRFCIGGYPELDQWRLELHEPMVGERGKHALFLPRGHSVC